MSAKARPPAAGKPKGPQAQQIKKEDIKQAVIVDYKAIGCRSPGASSNTKPLIQYTLEWLLIEKFDELFVCCLPDNVQEMRELVKVFLTTENVPPTMTIQVHASENNKSTGDCLRDLDSKALIKNDFVIMDVGCCGNLPLAELLESHKTLKKTDKNVILTSIVRNFFTRNPAEIGVFPIYITDNTSGLLLHYVAGRLSENDNRPGSSITSRHDKSVDVPTEIFLEREEVKVHTNLCSTNLSIYSANVPALFTELFDCHSEADLIQTAFDCHEVLGGTIYIHVIDDLFSQRMADFGFVINQKWDQFDTNLIYKRSARYQVLRKLVNDSLIDCTRLNQEDYLSNLNEDDDTESESDSEKSELDDDEVFLSEVLDSLVRGFDEKIENKNLVLEVNSSKHAYNISIEDVYSTIARALLLLPEKLTSQNPTSSVDYLKLVEKAIDKFEKFLLNYMKSDEAQLTMITSMEEMHLSNQIKYLNDIVLAKIISKLYVIDALEESSIFEWYKNYDQDDKLQKELRAKPSLKQLIKALESQDDSD